ncbi:sodium:solute symporter family protein [Calditrichota bacterium LG25]
MNLSFIDWLIVFSFILSLFVVVHVSKKLVQSVADFLSAGRSAGRYLLAVSQGIVVVGAITIVGQWEVNYVAGFTLQWWQFTMALVYVGITVTGWVLYRFRETRALTIAQFLEMRYSRKFRIFAGILAFFSGILNYGIFPLVTTNFLIYFIGLPKYFSVAGMDVPTFPIVMFILISISLYFVFSGGQIAAIFTDFIQGVFSNIAFILIIIFCLFFVNWDQIFQAVQTAPPDASLINPFKTSKTHDFNFWYFLIGVFGVIYTKLSWQGQQGFNSSAKSAHEAKMGDVLGNLRNIPRFLFMLFIPIVAYTILHNPDFSSIADKVQAILNGLKDVSLQNQLRTPLVLNDILPTGLKGVFLTMMLMAAFSTDVSYMHSWGSIFIQDVILPFRKKPFEPQQHIKILRISIIGVAIFIYIFSLIFPLKQYIYLYFAVTGAIFTGGSGAVIIGGLYWKKGTTPAAWSALIIGSIIAVTGIILNQIYVDFPINGQYFWAIAMGASSVTYIVISLLTCKKDFNLEKMLHRGKYSIEGESTVVDKAPLKGWRLLGINKYFTREDKIIYFSAYIWTFAWVVVFIIGTIINLTTDVSDYAWITFWKIYVYITIVVSIIVVVWFTIGGIKDYKNMIHILKTQIRDHKDDGTVIRDANE